MLSASAALACTGLEKSDISPIEMTLAGTEKELDEEAAAIRKTEARNSQTV
jgi:hypothetical protein